MKNSKKVLAGKIIAASSAIVLAGCLIKNEQDKRNVENIDSPVLTHISTSKSLTIDNDFIKSTVTDYKIKQQEKVLTTMAHVSMLSEKQLTELINNVELSRMGPEFFATSKSAPPKAVRNVYILEEHRGKTSQDINLTKLQQKHWELYKAKILVFHKNQKKNTTFIHSSKAPALAPDDIISNKPKEDPTYFSTSKSMLPDSSSPRILKLLEELKKKYNSTTKPEEESSTFINSSKYLAPAPVKNEKKQKQVPNQQK